MTASNKYIASLHVDKNCSIDSFQVTSIAGHEDAVQCLAFDRGGEFLVSGGSDLTVKVWSWPASCETEQYLTKMIINSLFLIFSIVYCIESWSCWAENRVQQEMQWDQENHINTSSSLTILRPPTLWQQPGGGFLEALNGRLKIFQAIFPPLCHLRF